jgi:hypothetical protein
MSNHKWQDNALQRSDCMGCSSFAGHAGAAEREAATRAVGGACQRQQGRASMFFERLSRKFTAECCSIMLNNVAKRGKQTNGKSVCSTL